MYTFLLMLHSVFTLVRYCAIEMATIIIIIIWNWPPNLKAKLGMVLHFHGLECAVERLDCYPLGQDDSEVQFLCLSAPHLLYQHIPCYQKLACWCVVTKGMAPIGLHIMTYPAHALKCLACPPWPSAWSQLHTWGFRHYKRVMMGGKHSIVQELCESRGGRPGLSVLTSLMVSVDVKNYWTVLRHWSQLVPNMSTDIWGH